MAANATIEELNVRLKCDCYESSDACLQASLLLLFKRLEEVNVNIITGKGIEEELLLIRSNTVAKIKVTKGRLGVTSCGAEDLPPPDYKRKKSRLSKGDVVTGGIKTPTKSELKAAKKQKKMEKNLRRHKAQKEKKAKGKSAAGEESDEDAFLKHLNEAQTKCSHCPGAEVCAILDDEWLCKGCWIAERVSRR